MLSVRETLMQQPIRASAPCRIDAGGTWDIKAFSLPFESLSPVTINAALTLRTQVILNPYENGSIRIASEGFGKPVLFSLEDLSFQPPFGLFLAAVVHFGFHGLDVGISSESPVKSALGGSSTALVALIQALSVLGACLGRRTLKKREILHLAYHLEDAVSGGNCGMQDQAAAVYGGVHAWEWQYGHCAYPVRKRRLLQKDGEKALNLRLLIAHSGETHVSAQTNRQWVQDFLWGRTRAGWVKANERIQALGKALEQQDWAMCVQCLKDEMVIRREITPEAFIPITQRLVEEAESCGCGGRFTGAGAGGVVWALGETEEQMSGLRKRWQSILQGRQDAAILKCAVDPKGVQEEPLLG